MPKKRVPYFNYNTVSINGHEYFKAYVMNADKKLVIVYGKTIEDLCQKYEEAERRSENDAFSRRSPTVKEYCENGSVYFTEMSLQEYVARSTHRAKPREVNTGTTFRNPRNSVRR